MTSTVASSALRRKMMLLAIGPTAMPSASAACCAVRAASSSITGVCGWLASCRARATRCTPSGSALSSAPHISGSPLVQDGSGRTRVRLPTEEVADELAGVDQLVEVDAGLDAKPLQQVDDVLGRNVARRALGIRAAAESRHRGVVLPDAHLEARHRVGKRPAVGVVEVARHVVERIVLQ